MSCPRTDELIKYGEGELSVNAHRELEAHLARCETCAAQRRELERLAARLAPDADELEDPQLVAAVMRRIEEEPAEAPIPWWRRLLEPRLLAPALAATAALVIALVLLPRGSDRPPRTSDQPQFRARGGGDAAAPADRWVKLLLYRATGEGKPYVPVADGSRVDAKTRLVVGYRNTGGRYRYLMVFAFNQAGNVYWYYPAHQRPEDDPASVAIKAGRQGLPDEIEHTLAGPEVTVMGLFSHEPLRVSQVEALVEDALRGRRLGQIETLPLPRTGQARQLLRVAPGAVGSDAR